VQEEVEEKERPPAAKRRKTNQGKKVDTKRVSEKEEASEEPEPEPEVSNSKIAGDGKDPNKLTVPQLRKAVCILVSKFLIE
jgi:hypothetical protein